MQHSEKTKIFPKNQILATWTDFKIITITVPKFQILAKSGNRKLSMSG